MNILDWFRVAQPTKPAAAKPVGMSSPRDAFPHGTINGYTTHKCRCEPCKTANTDYHRQWRAKHHGQEPPFHGYYGYTGYGCRCEVCTSAARDIRRKSARGGRSGGNVKKISYPQNRFVSVQPEHQARWEELSRSGELFRYDYDPINGYSLQRGGGGRGPCGPLGPKAIDALNFIEKFITEHGYSPSNAEIASAISLSISTCNRYLNLLRQQGMVTWEPMTPRSLRVTR